MRGARHQVRFVVTRTHAATFVHAHWLPATMSEVVTLDVPFDAAPAWLAARARLPATWALDAAALLERTRAALAAGDSAFRDALVVADGDVDMPTLPALEAAFAAALRRAQERGTAGRALLGGYADAELRTWDGLLRAWRAKSLYLVPVAWRLAQLLSYDVCVARAPPLQCLSRALCLASTFPLPSTSRHPDASVRTGRRCGGK